MKYSSRHTMRCGMVGNCFVTTRNFRRRSLAPMRSSCSKLDTSLPKLSNFGVLLIYHGKQEQNGKQIPINNDSNRDLGQKGVLGFITNKKSTVLWNYFNHNVVISFGTIIMCVEAWRFIRAFLNSSSAAKAAAGGGDHTIVADATFTLQKPSRPYSNRICHVLLRTSRLVLKTQLGFLLKTISRLLRTHCVLKHSSAKGKMRACYQLVRFLR